MVDLVRQQSLVPAPAVVRPNISLPAFGKSLDGVSGKTGGQTQTRVEPLGGKQLIVGDAAGEQSLAVTGLIIVGPGKGPIAPQRRDVERLLGVIVQKSFAP